MVGSHTSDCALDSILRRGADERPSLPRVLPREGERRAAGHPRDRLPAAEAAGQAPPAAAVRQRTLWQCGGCSGSEVERKGASEIV